MLYERNGIWWSQIKVRGEKRCRSMGTRNLRKARQLEAPLLRRAALERAGFVDPEPKRDPKTMAEHVEDYRLDLESRDRSKTHIRDSMRTLHAFVAWCKAKSVRALRHSHGAEFLRHESKRTCRPRKGQRSTPTRTLSWASVERERQVLRAWGGWLERDQRVERSPFRDLKRIPKRNRPPHKRRALTKDELQALVDAAPLYRAAVYLTAATTGLRRAELASVRLADVHLSAGVLHVQQGYTKDGEPATCVLSKGVRRALRELLPSRELYMSQAHTRVRRGREDHLFPTLPNVTTLRADLARAGVGDRDRVDFHALRKTFGTRLANSGVPMPMTQALMRHSDPSLTSGPYYDDTDEQRRRHAVSLIDLDVV